MRCDCDYCRQQSVLDGWEKRRAADIEPAPAALLGVWVALALLAIVGVVAAWWLP